MSKLVKYQLIKRKIIYNQCNTSSKFMSLLAQVLKILAFIIIMSIKSMESNCIVRKSGFLFPFQLNDETGNWFFVGIWVSCSTWSHFGHQHFAISVPPLRHFATSICSESSADTLFCIWPRTDQPGIVLSSTSYRHTSPSYQGEVLEGRYSS